MWTNQAELQETPSFSSRRRNHAAIRWPKQVRKSCASFHALASDALQTRAYPPVPKKLSPSNQASEPFQYQQLKILSDIPLSTGCRP